MTDSEGMSEHPFAWVTDSRGSGSLCRMGGTFRRRMDTFTILIRVGRCAFGMPLDRKAVNALHQIIQGGLFVKRRQRWSRRGLAGEPGTAWTFGVRPSLALRRAPPAIIRAIVRVMLLGYEFHIHHRRTGSDDNVCSIFWGQGSSRICTRYCLRVWMLFT
jgi:hypothetical protein